MPLDIAVPKVSLTCMNTTVFGACADRSKHFLLIDEGVAQDHARGGKIAEHEFVALLGDRRRGGDIDDERHALLLGDLRDRQRLAGIEGADQELRAVADQLLGARARAVSTLDSVSPSMIASSGRPRDLRIAGAMSTPRWQSWPMPA